MPHGARYDPIDPFESGNLEDTDNNGVAYGLPGSTRPGRMNWQIEQRGDEFFPPGGLDPEHQRSLPNPNSNSNAASFGTRGIGRRMPF